MIVHWSAELGPLSQLGWARMSDHTLVCILIKATESVDLAITTVGDRGID